MVVKVGYKGRFKNVAVPPCKCGADSVVSVPEGATTRHSCITCLANPPQMKNRRDIEFLKAVGLIG